MPASPSQPFSLYTDGSWNRGIGYVLIQEYGVKKHFIQLGSSTWQKLKEIFSTQELVMNLALFACEKYDSFW